MTKLKIRRNALGFEILDGEQLAALYRATEELPRTESPKPCFAPIYTPSGGLVTEYRPADHPWHTGLYFGWVFANGANLWGGPWYLPEKTGTSWSRARTACSVTTGSRRSMSRMAAWPSKRS